MQKTQAPSQGREDPLQEEMATHSSNSCLENPMDRGTWQATVQGVTKSQTQLSNLEHTHAWRLINLLPQETHNSKQESLVLSPFPALLSCTLHLLTQ